MLQMAWEEAENDTKKFVDNRNMNYCFTCPKSKCEWVPKASGKCAD